MINQQDVGAWLQEGIMAAKAGRYEQARFRLLDVVEQDQTNEVAWFWLYQVFDLNDDKRVCLENLLIINPQNQWAQRELLNYLGTNAPAPAKPKRAAVPLPVDSAATLITLIRLIAAFWLGISIILLFGGIMAVGEWLAAGLDSGDFVSYLTAFRIFEFTVGILFVTFGVVGINVAIGLFLRSMAGFYGSLLLALGLLLLGPTISLIITPPNFLAMICTGGIAGTMALLTLATQSGFK